MKEMFFQMENLPLSRPNTIIINLLMLGSELCSAYMRAHFTLMNQPITARSN